MIKRLIALTIFALLVGNLYIFVHTIQLSDDINRFEKEIRNIHQENLTLENKVFEVDSLRYAASLAAELDFSNKSEPFYLERLRYAFKTQP